MLTLLNRIAAHLHRFSGWLWLLLLVALASFVAIILSQDNRYDGYALLAAVAVLWAITGRLITSYFPVATPAVETTDGFWRRWKERLNRAVIWLVVALVTVAMTATAIATWRLLGSAAREFAAH